MVHLLVGLGGARDGRRGLVGDEQSAVAGVHENGSALVKDWRREGRISFTGLWQS